MRITSQAALLMLQDTGDEQLAWEIAQQDEGLLPDVTFNQWIAWAWRIITARNSTQRLA